MVAAQTNPLTSSAAILLILAQSEAALSRAALIGQARMRGHVPTAETSGTALRTLLQRGLLNIAFQRQLRTGQQERRGRQVVHVFSLSPLGRVEARRIEGVLRGFLDATSVNDAASFNDTPSFNDASPFGDVSPFDDAPMKAPPLSRAPSTAAVEADWAATVEGDWTADVGGVREETLRQTVVEVFAVSAPSDPAAGGVATAPSKSRWFGWKRGLPQ